MRKHKSSLDDPLGIADAPVPKDANDIHATNDPDEVARRRARARGETEPTVRGPGDDVTRRDLCVVDHDQHRSMQAREARVRHFSAGSGDLELATDFLIADLEP